MATRNYTIYRDSVYGWNLKVAGLPPIWCGTREIAATVYAKMLPL